MRSGKTMTLLDVVLEIDSFDESGTIYLSLPWTEASKAIVVIPSLAESTAVKANDCEFSYFLEIAIAREFLEDWMKTSNARPTLHEQCARLIQYVVNDA